jgi:NAD(P)H-dependent FMN reductase
MKLAAVLGSPTPPGRLFKAISWLLEAGRSEYSDVDGQLIDLRSHRISWADGRPLSEYGDDTETLVRKILGADAVLLATPIYRASYTGMLKNLLDLVPVEGLLGKPVGLVGIGATSAHYLALDNQLRPVLSWFGALTLPVTVYLQHDDFVGGEFHSEVARAEILALYRLLVETFRRLPRSSPLGPHPLAARRRT